MPKRSRLTLVLAVSATFVAGLTLAAESGPRAVISAVKQEIWKQACQLPEHDWDVDCSTNTDPTKCLWQRADGTKFQPLDTSNRVHSIARDFIWNVLSPTNDALKLGVRADDSQEDWSNFLFRLVSGFDLLVGDDYPMKLNPDAITWVERELLPAPSDALCGHTAQEMYDLSFKKTVESFALMLVELTKAGYLTKKVDVARLDKEYGRRAGGYWQTCQAIAKRDKTFNDQVLLADACFFWLRRGASNALPELAAFTARFVRTYDPAFFATHEKTFAKMLPPPPKTN